MWFGWWGTDFVTDGTFIDDYCNDFKGLYPDEIKYIEDFLTSPDEHEKDYKTLYSYYYEDYEDNEQLTTVWNELKHNINIHGINLIIRALKK